MVGQPAAEPGREVSVKDHHRRRLLAFTVHAGRRAPQHQADAEVAQSSMKMMPFCRREGSEAHTDVLQPDSKRRLKFSWVMANSKVSSLPQRFACIAAGIGAEVGIPRHVCPRATARAKMRHAWMITQNSRSKLSLCSAWLSFHEIRTSASFLQQRLGLLLIII